MEGCALTADLAQTVASAALPISCAPIVISLPAFRDTHRRDGGGALGGMHDLAAGTSKNQ